jgi:hypothetical protein
MPRRYQFYTFKVARQSLMTLPYKQGDSRSKMAGAGFHSIAISRALTPRFATIRITAWQSALNCNADCQPPALRPNTNPAGGSGLWHSALKFGPLTIAIRGTAIFSVAIRLENTALCQYNVTNLSAEFSNRVKSSPRHFTWRGPLFELSYIFK